MPHPAIVVPDHVRSFVQNENEVLDEDDPSKHFASSSQAATPQDIDAGKAFVTSSLGPYFGQTGGDFSVLSSIARNIFSDKILPYFQFLGLDHHSPWTTYDFVLASGSVGLADFLEQGNIDDERADALAKRSRSEYLLAASEASSCGLSAQLQQQQPITTRDDEIFLCTTTATSPSGNGPSSFRYRHLRSTPGDVERWKKTAATDITYKNRLDDAKSGMQALYVLFGTSLAAALDELDCEAHQQEMFLAGKKSGIALSQNPNPNPQQQQQQQPAASSSSIQHHRYHHLSPLTIIYNPASGFGCYVVKEYTITSGRFCSCPHFVHHVLNGVATVGAASASTQIINNNNNNNNYSNNNSNNNNNNNPNLGNSKLQQQHHHQQQHEHPQDALTCKHLLALHLAFGFDVPMLPQVPPSLLQQNTRSSRPNQQEPDHHNNSVHNNNNNDNSNNNRNTYAENLQEEIRYIRALAEKQRVAITKSGAIIEEAIKNGDRMASFEHHSKDCYKKIPDLHLGDQQEHLMMMMMMNDVARTHDEYHHQSEGFRVNRVMSLQQNQQQQQERAEQQRHQQQQQQAQEVAIPNNDQLVHGDDQPLFQDDVAHANGSSSSAVGTTIISRQQQHQHISLPADDTNNNNDELGDISNPVRQQEGENKNTNNNNKKNNNVNNKQKIRITQEKDIVFNDKPIQIGQLVYWERSNNSLFSRGANPFSQLQPNVATTFSSSSSSSATNNNQTTTSSSSSSSAAASSSHHQYNFNYLYSSFYYNQSSCHQGTGPNNGNVMDPPRVPYLYTKRGEGLRSFAIPDLSQIYKRNRLLYFNGSVAWLSATDDEITELLMKPMDESMQASHKHCQTAHVAAFHRNRHYQYNQQRHQYQYQQQQQQQQQQRPNNNNNNNNNNNTNLRNQNQNQLQQQQQQNGLMMTMMGGSYYQNFSTANQSFAGGSFFAHHP